LLTGDQNLIFGLPGSSRWVMSVFAPIPDDHANGRSRDIPVI
jgi:hypothetical protein